MNSLCGQQKELDEAIALDEYRKDRDLLGTYPSALKTVLVELTEAHRLVGSLAANNLKEIVATSPHNIRTGVE